MNKADLIEVIAKRTKTKQEASDAIDEMFSSMKDALKEGNKIQITGFGTFQVKDRKARIGRNPKTGESVEIPAKKVVKFKASKEII